MMFSVVLAVLRTSTTCYSSITYRLLCRHTHQVRIVRTSEWIMLTVTDHVALQTVTQGPDPNQLIDTYVAPMKMEPQYIVGSKPGPYVAQHSYNMFVRLGARIAMLGIDARVEVSSLCLTVLMQADQTYSAQDTKSIIPKRMSLCLKGYDRS